MYKLHLILKYLHKRRIAWVSLIAVTLCTTLVLVVISVMGGWLRMFRESFHGLAGDVMVTSRSLTGFGNYESIIKDVQKLPQVEAAVPVSRTFGLIKINNGSPDAVQVMGYPIDQIGKVNKFPQSLPRKYEGPLAQGKPPPPPSFNLIEGKDYEAIAPPGMKNPRRYTGMIMGAGQAGVEKDEEGNFHRPEGLLDAFVRLEVMGLSGDEVTLEGAKPTPNYYWVVDDSRTNIWALDSKTVYVPFDVLQKDLGMGERPVTNPDTHETSKLPARTTDIYIKAKPGANLQVLKKKVTQVVGNYYPFILRVENPPIAVETWEESNAEFIGAVEKEKLLVTFLFGIISVVAVFLIFCIFYMIVVEKTKDIGIIKSVGATNGGVAGIFLGYGLAIGIVGSGLGLLSGYLIVHNINYLHEQMGKLLHVQIWNPEVYAFDTIPNKMDPKEVTVILAIAIIAAVLGALIPAYRAARMNPVEALRWE